MEGGSGFFEDYYIAKDEKFILVTRKEFKKIMSELLSDYDDLSRKINSQILTYRNIVAIVEHYNIEKGNTARNDI